MCLWLLGGVRGGEGWEVRGARTGVAVSAGVGVGVGVVFNVMSKQR